MAWASGQRPSGLSFLGHEIRPKWTIEAGFRYMDVNYRGNTIFDVAMSGGMLSVSMSLK